MHLTLPSLLLGHRLLSTYLWLRSRILWFYFGEQMNERKERNMWMHRFIFKFYVWRKATPNEYELNRLLLVQHTFALLSFRFAVNSLLTKMWSIKKIGPKKKKWHAMAAAAIYMPNSLSVIITHFVCVSRDKSQRRRLYLEFIIIIFTDRRMPGRWGTINSWVITN